MAPQKGNGKKAQLKAARREQQQKKAAAKEQKKRQRQGEVDCDETPIDVLLQQLEEEQKRRQINKTQATLCSQPSPRAHASLTLLPSGVLLLFGGENYDGKKVRVYGDLFKWDMDKNEWRRLESPEMPKARCSHQAVYHNDAVYVFGGEFSTYYQFHHFKDFWRFDLKASLWNKILVECPTHVPSARSGHRMAVWRGLLILFGGFHDTGRDTRYFNDLYLFNFSENKWRKVEFPPHVHIPEGRGGFVFVVVGDVVLLHGGFTKVRDTHKRVQGKTFTDTWLLDLKPLEKGAHSHIPLWEKIKTSGTPPSPRTGMCATGYKSSVIVFGGVADQDDGGSNLASTFYNDIYSFDVPKRRWYRLELKREKAKTRTKKVVQRPVPESDERRKGDSASDEEDSNSGDDENWQKTFAYFDSKGRLIKLRLEDFPDFNPETLTSPSSGTTQEHQPKSALALPAHNEATNCSRDESTVASNTSANCGHAQEAEGSETLSSKNVAGNANVGGVPEASSALAASGKQRPSVFSADVPLPRLHGMLLVRGSNLVLMGGIMELGSKEITLDDCWTLNLNKRLLALRDKWVRVLEGTMHEQEWQGAETEAESSGVSSSGGESGGSGSESSESDEEDDDTYSDHDEYQKPAKGGRRRCRVREEIQQLRDEFGLDDPMETPAEGETLREFFERTKIYWIQKASATDPNGSGGKRSKEMTRAAFVAASTRVSFISDALRRMEELLEKQNRQSADDDSNEISRKGAGSRQRQ